MATDDVPGSLRDSDEDEAHDYLWARRAAGVACIATMVVLALWDAWSRDYAIDLPVYATLGTVGLLCFGIRGLRLPGAS